tara:strand:+ start:4007 stop:4231 length:225 start_codon:yes stop_codon:yes gene_type:complete
MRSYPIWIDVQACIYKSSKSYGARNRNKQDIYVGTSANNSHHFAEIVTRKCKDENGNTFFTLSIDGEIVKTKTI